MVRKLHELEEAAQLLGITPEQLNEMRDRREVYAVRDAGTWKFKSEEIDRLIAERAERNAAEQAAPEFAELDDGLDSILLSEVELGQSGPSTSSTVIGKSNTPSSPESDIQIARATDEDSIRPDGGDSSIKLDAGEGSSVRLTGGPQSDVRLASLSDIGKGGSGLSAKFDDLDTLDLDLPSPAESGISLGSDALRQASSDSLSLDDDDIPSPKEKPSAAHAEYDEESIDLSGSDDDLVLGGSGPGSDVTRSASDSGISLVDPADSGLSLETSDLKLGGPSVESLSLGGDEEDVISLDEEGDPAAATQLKADDEFLLTPLEEAGGDESDSGSQVIALDSDVEFGESSGDDMFGAPLSGVTALEDGEEDAGELGGLGVAAGLSQTQGTMVAAVPDITFSGWSIAFLSFGLVFLLLSGIMMYDLMRNMWSWSGPYSVNSSLMDSILGLFEGK